MNNESELSGFPYGDDDVALTRHASTADGGCE